jgi:hypothetical protein
MEFIEGDKPLVLFGSPSFDEAFFGGRGFGSDFKEFGVLD